MLSQLPPAIGDAAVRKMKHSIVDELLHQHYLEKRTKRSLIFPVLDVATKNVTFTESMDLATEVEWYMQHFLRTLAVRLGLVPEYAWEAVYNQGPVPGLESVSVTDSVFTSFKLARDEVIKDIAAATFTHDEQILTLLDNNWPKHKSLDEFCLPDYLAFQVTLGKEGH